MTKPHRATPEQWESIEVQYADFSDFYSCFLELRARIEALEAAQQPPQDKMDRLIALDADDADPIGMPSSPADSLIDRVANVLALTHPSIARGMAYAVILEVAAWLSEEPFGLSLAMRLEREASNG